MGINKIISLEEWEEKSPITDCKECPEDLCDICNGPEYLPHALREKTEKPRYDNKKTGCLDCHPPKKLEICCFKHPITGESKEVVIQHNDEFYLMNACVNIRDDGKCAVYHTKWQICTGHNC
ncbi:MAG: hypothetical protein ABIF10_04215 [Candidatus Woesearchaeota archaeon]